MKKQLLIILGIFGFLFAGTILVIMYGRGYRLSFNNNKPDVSGTGLLVATSNPNGASVYIDGHLTTATDNTINLPPGKYDVKISKEGYFSWQKQIKVQEEVVSKADAVLFATAPKLESVTASGAQNPVIDPSMTKVAYSLSSQEPKKNGLYILDMTSKPILTLQSASTQIADDTIIPFSKASISWSPDGKEILATTSATNKTTYLLDSSGFNENPKDVTETLSTVEDSWRKDKQEKEKARFDGLKQTLQKTITDDFTILSWSLDETKILYQASQSAELPIIINPRLIGFDSTPEERQIKKGSVYAYDIKEDKNYKILDSLLNNCKLNGNELENCYLPINWMPDSKHLLFISNKKINIMDYDAANSTTIYAGPFMDNYVFPWTSVSKILILTNLNNSDSLPNLYTIGLQ